MIQTKVECDCNDGFVFNFQTRKNEPCGKCREMRRQIVKEATLGDSDDTVDLEELLGFGNRYINKEYEFASVVPNSERVFLTPESLEMVEKELEGVYASIMSGEPLDESKCFGLGIKGNVERVAFPFLVKAWEKGYTVHRMVSALEYNRMVNREDVEVEEMLKKDIVMIWITDGCSSREIDSVKGLMQTRAIQGRATYLVTTWLIQACSGLLFAKDEPVMGLAKPVFVEYKRDKSKGTDIPGGDFGGRGGSGDSSYIQRLKGVENRSATERGDVYPVEERVSKAPVISFHDLSRS